jgi:8-oxo-dGTP diphosphatase
MWLIVKEAARHVLRRPVVGVMVAARTADGRWLLVKRGDSGQWALPGGTLEWGETLHHAAARELLEEAGASTPTLGRLLGVYAAPERDPRFHAVTVLVEAQVSPPFAPPHNTLEVSEARLFSDHELPAVLSHGTTDMLHDARAGRCTWE